jgi:hypothetical protein
MASRTLASSSTAKMTGLPIFPVYLSPQNRAKAVEDFGRIQKNPELGHYFCDGHRFFCFQRQLSQLACLHSFGNIDCITSTYFLDKNMLLVLTSPRSKTTALIKWALSVDWGCMRSHCAKTSSVLFRTLCLPRQGFLYLPNIEMVRGRNE